MRLIFSFLSLFLCVSVFSQPFATVKSPVIPKTVKFANQEISLDRSDMYERFDRELTSLIYSHGSTLLTVKRANRYFPVLEKILKENNVPTDFLYLACVESLLDTRAYSSAKAAGIWQFIPGTARQYGLEVTDYVDERYNIEKETVAACNYFKNAYAKYGNWESVAASYNAGTGRISSELQSQMVESAYDLHLPKETARYIYRILATKVLMENLSSFGYNIMSDQLYQPLNYTNVEVSTSVDDWQKWAKEHGINYSQLREYNPWIVAKSLPNKAGKSYQVKIPTEKGIFRQKTTIVFNKNWVID